ncbi:DUF3817 domain-containing protein [Phycisphaera mikurensis]|uniref:DUF3817 domain-containing protein n=1 Tax=Phycisphaera mikurensis (strain NBRC 102666 / KCTC 22515 / FYK2301M01) TaxID=1142394 RepID=I0IGD2_PHYMF|nr:DUF3817 domain-containing protein [Phycisphaera mikurensis]MBB6440302.1 integral membrane protein [Phycisphaera mikurensis]BAM04320.1 hypothetical protein PSMK_21610 [Phycisphaera mikurensis NBRC 102666]
MSPPPARTAADRLLRPTRWLGFVEGASFLVLLFVAMPLKHVAGDPRAVSLVGGLHGGLFVLFVAALTVLVAAGSLSLRRGLLGVVASILPFGPWLLDHRIYPPESPKAAAGPAASAG